MTSEGLRRGFPIGLVRQEIEGIMGLWGVNLSGRVIVGVFERSSWGPPTKGQHRLPVVVDSPIPVTDAAGVTNEASVPHIGSSDDLSLDLREHAELVAGLLRSTLEEVVLAISGPRPRPSHLITRLGLDKTLAGHIIQTLRSTEPLAALSRCPSPVGLEMFLRGAKQAGARVESISRAEDAVARFEGLLSRFPRGRAGLEAAISGWMPEVREQGERAARLAAFNAMSFILGYQSDVTLGCSVLRPWRGWAVGGCGVCRGAVWAAAGCGRASPFRSSARGITHWERLAIPTQIPGHLMAGLSRALRAFLRSFASRACRGWMW